jgi:hypothetical protein
VYFNVSIMSSFPTLYYYIIFFHFHWFQLSYNLWKNYISILTSRLYITPHSTFHIPHSMSSLVVRSIAEPKLFNVKLSSILKNAMQLKTRHLTNYGQKEVQNSSTTTIYQRTSRFLSIFSLSKVSKLCIIS